MNQLPAKSVIIKDAYWSPRQEINAKKAVFHQWEELEKSGCIDNFRIVCGEKDGFREGWVFADSDAYKWLEAASRIYGSAPNPELKVLMDELILLLARTQMEDGYIYTFNQFHFPGQRWVNLQIEHELYCHGHLIEAGVSHFEATGERSALDIAVKAADLLVRSFSNASPESTDGHQEVEIALIRLSLLTGRQEYLNLAQHFIEVRGRIPFYALLYQRQNSSHAARKAHVKQKRAEYAGSHPEYAVSKIPPDNESKEPRFSKQRRKLNAWGGFYTQQHVPVRRQTVPVGHAVRYGYFQTAIGMLYRLRGDASLLSTLQQSWNRLVTKRMYVTGGIGSLPGNEGFGSDYELDPEYAYNETCAALASLFWNWEMALATNEARYSDLFEWQLYNAAAVGMGLDGSTYLYNNPLCVHAGILRRTWYSVPCCPSNLSRTWASLGKYIYSFDEHNLWIHQYIGNETERAAGMPAGAVIDSELPFSGTIKIRIESQVSNQFTLHIRIPSWCKKDELDRQVHPGREFEGCLVKINGEVFPIPPEVFKLPELELTAQGFDPRASSFLHLSRVWNPGDVVNLTFEMPITLRQAHPRVKNHAGKVAVTRGPLVYCLESTDNPGVALFETKLDSASLAAQVQDTALGRITILIGKSTKGETLTFIPYHLWGNRGGSQMVVWINGPTQLPLSTKIRTIFNL